MENIDIIFLIQPLITTVACFALIIYYNEKNRYTKWVFLYSLAAYAIAILAKEAIQIPTVAAVTATNNLVLLGFYYGLQTVFLEVGLAYLFAHIAYAHKQIHMENASAYGASLAFWENAVLLGLIPLINYASYYAILSTNTSAAQTLYSTLSSAEPGLFLPPALALSGVVWGTLERVSSILGHFAWGYLCVVAACLHKKKYFLYALPMGFLDFLVPFAPLMPIYEFELIVFAWALISLAVALVVQRKLTRSGAKEIPPEDTGKAPDNASKTPESGIFY
jgi:hypothetical protein